MGIRFLCPNGHKLNVKADLAGKRAICPDCGAKLVVPTADAGAALSTTEMKFADAPDRAATGPVRHEPPAMAAPAPPTANGAERGEPLGPAAAAPPPRGLWYVRPESGGQFGPADDEVFRSWIAEGRVTADAHVWREGWANWRTAREAADVLPAPLAAVPVATCPTELLGRTGPATESATRLPAVPTEAEPAEPDPAAAESVAAPAVRYRVRQRRSKQTQRTLAVLMLLAVLVLTGVLIWVIRRDSGPAPAGPSSTAIPAGPTAIRTR